MIKLILLPIFILLYIFTNGQTGPGGVGNSSTNGLWLKADEISQANNTVVSSWNDQSGNNNNAGQATVGKQPTYFSTSTLNNMPIVRFDGSNDEMAVPDANILDGTNGITYFAVIRPNNLNGSPRGIIGKRITYTVSTEYAYTCFFWSGNYLNLDVHTQNNRFNTNPSSFSNATNYVLGWKFDGTLPTGQRSKVWSQGNLIKQANESSTTLPNSNQDLAIGALNVGYGTYLGADYAELIQYNYALNSAEHIIVENYLAAKYGITLGSNDIYTMDNTLNGDFDHDVAGIGRNSATEINDDAQGSGIVRIYNPTGLDDNEYYIWGHDNNTLGAFGSLDFPIGLEGRLFRVWRGNEVNISGSSVDVGSVDISFDLTGLGPITAANLRLLIDSDNDGLFADETPISGSVDLGGNIFEFSGVNGLSNGLRFTLGTTDIKSTPLPIELLSFNAIQNNKVVDLSWETASEKDNDYFVVERSVDGMNWEKIVTTNGAGTSTSLIEYFESDFAPSNGINYYRLKQVDFNGEFTYSNIVPVDFKKENQSIEIYPNPNDGNYFNIDLKEFENKEILLVLRNINGQEVFNKVFFTYKNQSSYIEFEKPLASGTYLVIASSENQFVSKKLVVK